MYIPNACSGYVFRAVRLRQFVHSTCLGARLWLNHDPEVIFDGHPDDVRTIWPLEHGFLLLHERDLSSKPHSVLSFSFLSRSVSQAAETVLSSSLSCHGQSARRLKLF